MNSHCIHSRLLISQKEFSSEKLRYQMMKTRLQLLQSVYKRIFNIMIFSTLMEKKFVNLTCLTINGVFGSGHQEQVDFISITIRTHSGNQTHYALYLNFSWTLLHTFMTDQQLSPSTNHLLLLQLMTTASLSTILILVISIDNSTSIRIVNEFKLLITVLIMNICMFSLIMFQL